MHTTTAHNRFLGGLGGYNGLPTVMSGLDESLSDVTPKKKYPFELEKALHNVMFIQHHIQRQDEFNAVTLSIIYRGKLGGSPSPNSRILKCTVPHVISVSIRSGVLEMCLLFGLERRRM